MKKSFRAVAAAFHFAMVAPIAAYAGGAASVGNRLVIVTYWGDDEIALVDLQGQPGAETVFRLDVLKDHGCSKPYDVKVNSQGSRAYVTCSGASKLIIVDLVAQLVAGEIPTQNGPRDIALTKDETRAIVANSGSDTISVIDIPGRRILYNISNVGNQPYGTALTNDEKIIVSTAWASGDVFFIEIGATAGTVLGRTEVGPLPYTVVIPPEENIAYVTVNASHSVVALDIAGRRITATIPVGRNPWGAAPSVDGRTIVVANNRSNNISILTNAAARGALMIERTRVTLGSGGRAATGQAVVESKAKNASISADGKTGVFTDLANNELMLVDLQSGVKTRTIGVGKAPYGIEFVR